MLSDSEDEIIQFFHNYQKISASGLYSFECCKISQRTRLNIPFFQFMLELLKYGFPIGFVGKLNKKQGYNFTLISSLTLSLKPILNTNS